MKNSPKKKSLFRSAGVFASMTFLSRVMGFIRDMVVAYVFGAGADVDAYIVALKIPNFLRRLFAEGAFSQAFVPILSEYKERHGPQQMQNFVNRTAGTLAAALLGVTILAELLAPLLVLVFAPGFHADPHRYALATTMLHITFPYLLLISLVAFAGALLNTHGIFGPPSFTPVLLNLSLISTALLLAPYFQQPIIALAWGVFLGGVVQLLFQLPFLAKIKLIPRLRFGWRDPGVRRVMKLMVPALFGVSVAQLSLMIDTIFASFLKAGSISWLYYSDRLMQFPLGMFGAGIATVILPSLSRKHAAKSDQAYADTMDWALRSILLVGTPAAMGLLMLAGPLLATLLHRGQFNNNDVLMAQQSLMAFAIGLPAFMLVKVLASGFYSRQNIRTPVKIAALAMVTNMILNLILIFPLAHAGLALATSLSAYLNAGLLAWMLNKRKVLQIRPEWKRFGFQLLFANGIMAILVWLFTAPLKTWLAWTWQTRSLHLLMLISIGVVSYFVVLWLLGLRKSDFLEGAF